MRRPHEVRLLREALGVPAFEVALAAGITPTRLSRIERGLDPPSTGELERILRALGPEAQAGLPAAIKFLNALEAERRGRTAAPTARRNS